MSTKIDIEALESKATRAAKAGDYQTDSWYPAFELGDHLDSYTDALYIEAVPPCVTLALIARIAELERLCAMLIRDHVGSECYRAELLAEIRKGAVMP